MPQEFPMQTDASFTDGSAVFIEPRADGSADLTIELSRETAEIFAARAKRDGKTWNQFGTEIMLRLSPDVPYRLAELLGMGVAEAISEALDRDEE